MARFKVSLDSTGSLVLEATSETVDKFFTGWPFEKQLGNTVVYTNSNRIAHVKLSKLENYLALREFVYEMLEVQLENKVALLAQIDAKIQSTSATSAPMVDSGRLNMAVALRQELPNFSTSAQLDNNKTNKYSLFKK